MTIFSQFSLEENTISEAADYWNIDMHACLCTYIHTRLSPDIVSRHISPTRYDTSCSFRCRTQTLPLSLFFSLFWLLIRFSFLQSLELMFSCGVLLYSVCFSLGQDVKKDGIHETGRLIFLFFPDFPSVFSILKSLNLLGGLERPIEKLRSWLRLGFYIYIQVGSGGRYPREKFQICPKSK